MTADCRALRSSASDPRRTRRSSPRTRSRRDATSSWNGRFSRPPFSADHRTMTATSYGCAPRSIDSSPSLSVKPSKRWAWVTRCTSQSFPATRVTHSSLPVSPLNSWLSSVFEGGLSDSPVPRTARGALMNAEIEGLLQAARRWGGRAAVDIEALRRDARRPWCGGNGRRSAPRAAVWPSSASVWPARDDD